jgi:hypothetical protein
MEINEILQQKGKHSEQSSPCQLLTIPPGRHTIVLSRTVEHLAFYCRLTIIA